MVVCSECATASQRRSCLLSWVLCPSLYSSQQQPDEHRQKKGSQRACTEYNYQKQSASPASSFRLDSPTSKSMKLSVAAPPTRRVSLLNHPSMQYHSSMQWRINCNVTHHHQLASQLLKLSLAQLLGVNCDASLILGKSGKWENRG